MLSPFIHRIRRVWDRVGFVGLMIGLFVVMFSAYLLVYLFEPDQAVYVSLLLAFVCYLSLIIIAFRFVIFLLVLDFTDSHRRKG